MKTDRLFGIVTILLNREKVTASYLADKFEVSRRTIIRDIEAICMSGIPLITEAGRKGGVSVASGYKIDKTIISEEELQLLSSGLHGLNSVLAGESTFMLFDKLIQKDKNAVKEPVIRLELASHYKESLSIKIELLRKAIEEKYLVSFCYFYRGGEEIRKIEPYQILFCWSSWYIYGYCRKRQAFRLFKLNRLWRLQKLTEYFIPRDIPEDIVSDQKVFPTKYKLKALFKREVKYRLIEEYGPDCFVEKENGLYVELDFTYYDVLVSWILGFGSSVKVLEPEFLLNDVRQEAEKILLYYKTTNDISTSKKGDISNNEEGKV